MMIMGMRLCFYFLGFTGWEMALVLGARKAFWGLERASGALLSGLELPQTRLAGKVSWWGVGASSFDS